MSDDTTVEPLKSPGKPGGLKAVTDNFYLLKLIVRKDLRVRYRGSFLGILWSYVKPTVQFLAYYVALGVFLGLNKNVPYFPVYLFSGIIVINFFSEAMGNASRSIRGNSALIKKVFMPRELFPLASIWVAIVHFIPQLVVLVVVCLCVGWRPNPFHLVMCLAVFVIVAVFALGLGLFFSAINVFYRDAENFVDLILMVATWFSPVIYMFSMVKSTLNGFWLTVYQLNPLTVAVETFHIGFWQGTWDDSTLSDMFNGNQERVQATLDRLVPPDHLFTLWIPIALGVALISVIIGEITFRRLEGRFAQEM